MKSGKKKLLKGAVAEHEIKDRPGWHYEIDVMPDYGRKKKGAAV